MRITDFTNFTNCHAGLPICWTTSNATGKKQYSANICSYTECGGCLQGKENLAFYVTFCLFLEHTCAYFDRFVHVTLHFVTATL